MVGIETHMDHGGTATARVPRRTVIRALLVIAAVLVLGSLAVQTVKHGLGHGGLLGLSDLLNMGLEGNLPSWFSSVLLLACAGTLGVISAAASRQGDIDARGWGLLAVLFLAASADEAASIHESVGIALASESGLYWYLLPGTLLLAFVGYALRGLIARLPASLRRRLVLGAAIWAFGAIVLELVEAAASEGTAVPGMGLEFLNTCQDAFELLGAIVILDGLARLAQVRRYRVLLEVADPRS